MDLITCKVEDTISVPSTSTIAFHPNTDLSFLKPETYGVILKHKHRNEFKVMMPFIAVNKRDADMLPAKKITRWFSVDNQFMYCVGLSVFAGVFVIFVFDMHELNFVRSLLVSCRKSSVKHTELRSVHFIKPDKFMTIHHQNESYDLHCNVFNLKGDFIEQFEIDHWLFLLFEYMKDYTDSMMNDAFKRLRKHPLVKDVLIKAVEENWLKCKRCIEKDIRSCDISINNMTHETVYKLQGITKVHIHDSNVCYTLFDSFDTCFTCQRDDGVFISLNFVKNIVTIIQ